jgi:hypothetical protein
MLRSSKIVKHFNHVFSLRGCPSLPDLISFRFSEQTSKKSPPDRQHGRSLFP